MTSWSSFVTFRWGEQEEHRICTCHISEGLSSYSRHSKAARSSQEPQDGEVDRGGNAHRNTKCEAKLGRPSLLSTDWLLFFFFICDCIFQARPFVTLLGAGQD